MLAFHTLLALHVFCGSLALLAGPVPMLSRKGSRLHRKAGFMFAAAMGLGAVSAFVLALTLHDRLLLTVAVLTAFLIFSGMRASKFRRGAHPVRIDGWACLLLAGFGIWLGRCCISPLDATGLFFGAGSLVLAARQWQLLSSTHPDWLLAHIAGMGGAYVATATAFMVVNLDFLPKAVVFIVPAVTGSLLITWASLRHASRSPGTQQPPGHERPASSHRA